MEFLKFSYLAASMPDYWELSFKTSMLSLHNRTICCHILVEVGDGITGALELAGTEWLSAGGLRPDGESVVNIIFVKAGGLDLLRCQILGKLVDDGCHDFQVAELLRAYMCIVIAPLIFQERMFLKFQP